MTETVLISQPIARFQGQASDVDIARKEISNVKAELVYHSSLNCLNMNLFLSLAN